MAKLRSLLRLLSTTTDPSSTDPALYFNSTRGALRLTNGSVWRDLSPVNETVYSDTNTLLAVGAGTRRLYNGSGVSRVIVGVVASVSVAPSGAAAVVDLNKGGVTVFTTQGNRPSVAAGAFVSALAVPDVTAWAAGEYLTVDIDASSSAGGLSLAVLWAYA